MIFQLIFEKNKHLHLVAEKSPLYRALENKFHKTTIHATTSTLPDPWQNVECLFGLTQTKLNPDSCVSAVLLFYRLFGHHPLLMSTIHPIILLSKTCSRPLSWRFEELSHVEDTIPSILSQWLPTVSMSYHNFFSFSLSFLITLNLTFIRI